MKLFNIEASRNLTLPDMYINIGHFLDHFMMLIFAKAAFDAGRHFGLSYDEIIIYGTLGLFLFGAAAPLAGWLADKYSRSLIIIIYPFGVSLGAFLCFLSSSPIMLGFSIGVIGFFAAIFHPVGIAMLIRDSNKVGIRLGVNGVWGNMGVAAAPVLTGFIILNSNWQLSFLVPSLICLIFGIAQLRGFKEIDIKEEKTKQKISNGLVEGWKIVLLSLTMTTLAGGFIFGSLTFLIPRIFEVNLSGISVDIAITGLLAGIVYAIASLSQVGVGYLIDRYSPKIILGFVGIGQFFLIYLSSLYIDYALFFVMLMAMFFVFGQVPITDAILVRYVDDQWRARILSVKFLINLCAGASVLPLVSLFLGYGYTFSDLLTILSCLAIFVVISAYMLPKIKDNKPELKIA
ncbi:MAG: MFS transporter [Alphaproteobacteria bacterium]|nr:MAG: MFS transporter [Alphaproteobacteria bacterium]|tara:strand:+ start:894 stop:2102 length:1209 start_codon:yes stop_codon:yes gene_type:complete